jgi:hypothetical protein
MHITDELDHREFDASINIEKYGDGMRNNATRPLILSFNVEMDTTKNSSPPLSPSVNCQADL